MCLNRIERWLGVWKYGLQVSKGGIQNKLDFKPKLNILEGNFVNKHSAEALKIGRHFE